MLPRDSLFAKLLRVSDIFVSHRHVDHFIGFDQILRLLLGRHQKVRVSGPEGFIEAVDRSATLRCPRLLHSS
jgi:ribonuclease BN (tRNA processing enzyme)